MAQPDFFKQTPSLTLAEIAASAKVELVDPSRADQLITGLAARDEMVGAAARHKPRQSAAIRDRDARH